MLPGLSVPPPGPVVVVVRLEVEVEVEALFRLEVEVEVATSPFVCVVAATQTQTLLLSPLIPSLNMCTKGFHLVRRRNEVPRPTQVKNDRYVTHPDRHTVVRKSRLSERLP